MKLTVAQFTEPVRIGRFVIDAGGLGHPSFKGRRIAPAELANGGTCDFLRRQKGVLPTEYATIVQAVHVACLLHHIAPERNRAVAVPDVEILAYMQKRGR